MTHNTIDRLRGGTLNLPGPDGKPAGQLFHSGENYWTDRYADPDQDTNTGIFFLADGKEADMLEPIMHLYRHWGFGADRSTGKGFFEASFGKIDFPPLADANAMLNLSLFRPTPDELKLLDDAAEKDDTCFHYNIEIRQGYVSARKEIRKQAHRYFSEGSVLPLVKKGHLGRLEKQSFIKEKAPSHPVFDNGFGFMLPLKWQ
jgi:CRISPR type III-A-associated RAMP protein Csm4